MRVILLQMSFPKRQLIAKGRYAKLCIAVHNYTIMYIFTYISRSWTKQTASMYQVRRYKTNKQKITQFQSSRHHNLPEGHAIHSKEVRIKLTVMSFSGHDVQGIVPRPVLHRRPGRQGAGAAPPPP